MIAKCEMIGEHTEGSDMNLWEYLVMVCDWQKASIYRYP